MSAITNSIDVILTLFGTILVVASNINLLHLTHCPGEEPEPPTAQWLYRVCRWMQKDYRKGESRGNIRRHQSIGRH